MQRPPFCARFADSQELHPERVHYYLEKRDPEFESK